MKKKLTYLFALLFVFMIGKVVFGQATHTIDFEPAGVGADWEWTVGENGDNPPLEFISNPDPSGINTSATVAKFIARQAGQQWALFFTDDDGQFTFDATNSTVKIMVWKPVISPVHFKVEGATGTPTELTVDNTVTNQWEELTFDFSSVEGQTYNRLVILPDFYARPQDNTMYVDNIQVPNGEIIILPEPTVPAPTPTLPQGEVISIYSDAYTTLPGVNLNPNWGQGTQFSLIAIQGDSTMVYGNLNFQGTELNQNLNLDSAGMQYVHIDFWTPNSTELNFFLINPGAIQQSVALVPPGTTEQWTSVFIPLTDFEPTVDLTKVFQLMFTGNGTIYLDNIYFSTMVSDVKEITGVLPSDYNLEQNYPNPFNPTTNIRFGLTEANQVNLIVYNTLGQEVATLVKGFMNAGTYEVNFDAQNLPTGTYFYSIIAGDFNSVKKMLLIK
jgi:hypothetical protein